MNQNVAVKISIVEGSLTGSAVYQETHSVTTGQTGVFNLNIGGGTPLMGTFATINWASGNKFVKTEIDPANGTNYTLVSTSQLLSVPYALYAEKAKAVEYSASANGFDRKKFPDGFQNADTLRLKEGTTYTVPSGKNIYFIKGSLGYGFLIVNSKDTVTLEGYTATVGAEIPPFVIGGNSTIEVKGGIDVFGFVVNATVTPVIISRQTEYTVPSGFQLYIYRINNFIEPSVGYSDPDNGVFICQQKWEVVPFFNSYYDYIPSGTLIKSKCSVVMGYLMPE